MIFHVLCCKQEVFIPYLNNLVNQSSKTWPYIDGLQFTVLTDSLIINYH